MNLKETKFLVFTLMVLILAACQPVTNSDRRISNEIGTVKKNPTGGNSTGGNNSVGNEDPLGEETDVTVNTKAEIRHVIDPFDGTYTTKLTLPRNFSGIFYLAGLNLTNLRDKILYVRFNFGINKHAVVLPAVLGRAPGLIPQTDIEVLAIDMKSAPFSDVRLLYDLYDYNDYRDSSGLLTVDNPPTTDPRDNGLYCRGLRLEDDPTYEKIGFCQESGDKCLYAYAKIMDSGLYTNVDPNEPVSTLSYYYPLTISDAQIDMSEKGYDQQSVNQLIKKCLPDLRPNDHIALFNEMLRLNPALATLNFGDIISPIDPANQYQYGGPYRPSSYDLWEISGQAVFGDYGIFQDQLDSIPSNLQNLTRANQRPIVERGFRSKLFPLAGTMPLRSGVEYYKITDGASDTPWGSVMEVYQSLTAGESRYLQGCNLRVTSFDHYNNIGLSSCNVTATIELFSIDKDTKAEIIHDRARSVKLQLIRESVTDYQGKEVLYTSMKKCGGSNNACGVDECCYNDRCWSKNLVSRCMDEIDEQGNLGIGQNCRSDYECQSLCCNQGTSKCAVHNTLLDPPVYCSKVPGQKCVAKKWCRQENVTYCLVVNTGRDLQGNVTCALRCLNVPTFGDCIDGMCYPPVQPVPCPFNAAEPDPAIRCALAVDPLVLQNLDPTKNYCVK